MPEIFDLPDHNFRTMELRLSTPQSAVRSPYSGARSVSSNPWHGRWTLSAEHVPIIGEANFRPWRALLAKLKGQENKFRMPAGEGPQTDVAVGVTVYGDNQTLPRSSLIVQLAPNVPGFPEAGMFLTIQDQLLLITASEVVTGIGVDIREISFQPPLRTYAPHGTAVEAVEPYAVLALDASETGWSVGPGQAYALSLAGSEAW